MTDPSARVRELLAACPTPAGPPLTVASALSMLALLDELRAARETELARVVSGRDDVLGRTIGDARCPVCGRLSPCIAHEYAGRP